MPSSLNPLLKAGAGHVALQYPDGHEKVVQQTFPAMADALAEVGYELGHTMNLGNFESLKVTVSVRLPALADMTSLNLVFTEAREWVDDKLTQVIAEANQMKAAKAHG